jgi:Restriction endonuclease
MKRSLRHISPEYCSKKVLKISVALRRQEIRGADLLVKKNGRKIAIQAKRYTGSVGDEAVQEIVGAPPAQAIGGVGTYTPLDSQPCRLPRRNRDFANSYQTGPM